MASIMRGCTGPPDEHRGQAGGILRHFQAFFPGQSATVRVPRVDGARAASTPVRDGRTGWLRVFPAPEHSPACAELVEAPARPPASLPRTAGYLGNPLTGAGERRGRPQAVGQLYERKKWKKKIVCLIKEGHCI
jgi:hypothetical protein